MINDNVMQIHFFFCHTKQNKPPIENLSNNNTYQPVQLYDLDHVEKKIVSSNLVPHPSSCFLLLIVEYKQARYTFFVKSQHS